MDFTKHTLADLKTLDVGYGYTADGGKTFPFRHKGVGLMPSLDEVIAAFPGKRFLIHIKSNDPAADSIGLAKAYRVLGDAQAGTGDLAAARSSWQAALASFPRGVAERPAELAEHRIILQRLGLVQEANAIARRLEAAGFRRLM